MTEDLPEDIRRDFARACDLHRRTSSDYAKCLEFNKLMSDLLGRLEDIGSYRIADRVMSILLECNPREGCHCDNSTRVGEKIKKF
jgi:hypothetical protein